jgi:hypothetical protein
MLAHGGSLEPGAWRAPHTGGCRTRPAVLRGRLHRARRGYWALKSWQRNLPVGGFPPWTAARKAVELHLSHWSGPLPVLQIHRHWDYGGTRQGLFGRMTYLGQPVYGTRTASAAVNDTWARNI